MPIEYLMRRILILFIGLIFSSLIFIRTCDCLNNVTYGAESDLKNLQLIALYDRVKGSYNIDNPYVNLTSSQVCKESNEGMSGHKNYELWKVKYSNCVYLEGNLKLMNFYPDDDGVYDFSFLQNIAEITGYLVIESTNLKSFTLKNLRIIRGHTLFTGNHSFYISKNNYLESISFPNLQEIQSGSIVVRSNPNLCHSDDINWKDLIGKQTIKEKIVVEDNKPKNECPQCDKSCCRNATLCNCWNENTCQKLTKTICHSRCEGRCFGSEISDCCHSQCAAGCFGPYRHQCSDCKNFRIKDTEECVEHCERIEIADPATGQMVLNKKGMYQHMKSCVKECPDNWVIYRELCLKSCPPKTFEVQVLKNNKTFIECKECTEETCPKTCTTNNDYITKKNIYNLTDCEVLNGPLLIIEAEDQSEILTEKELEILSSIKIVNDYVRIQLYHTKSLYFLRNLEKIRGRKLLGSTYAFAFRGHALTTLKLKKLRSIENGNVVISADALCLAESINWKAMFKSANQDVQTQKARNASQCAKDNIVCDSMCSGCWSVEDNMCQFCKTYKIGDACIGDCKTKQYKGRYLYVLDEDNRVCEFCHPQCKQGCTGPSEFECIECANVYIYENETHVKCLDKCPLTHYSNAANKRCMPCYSECEGCLGPDQIISPQGCIKCVSAIVDNDDKYTTLQCYGERTCEDGFYPRIVPAWIKDHPHQNQTVCRKCHPECITCYGEGTTNCHECVNLRALRNNNHECVSNCSQNEFLDASEKICRPCNSECELGCSGPESYHCNTCKHFKMPLKEFFEQYQNSSKMYRKSLYNYNYNITKLIEAKQMMCLDKCPEEFPYFDENLFCFRDKLTDDKDENLILLLKIAVLVVVTILIIAFIFIWYCFILKQRQREWEKMQEDFANPDDGSEDGGSSKADLAKLKILTEKEFKKLQELGSGAFGTVFRGIFFSNDAKHELQIAIKVINHDSSSEKTQKLLDEARIMASVQHPYCLRLIGICMTAQNMIITPLMPYGSVLDFFAKHKSKVKSKMLLIWAEQIAKGMEYLENREIVHCDLAARNVLVQSYGHIKITDFGLSKILDYGQTSYQGNHGSKLPLKWLAPESMLNLEFTHKSDVWSYGVTCWELFTFGMKPYASVENIAMFRHLKQGARLPQPQIASLDVYMLLIRCWIESPEARPSFSYLATEFAKMSKDPNSYLVITADSFDEPVINTNVNVSEFFKQFTVDNRMEKRSDSDENKCTDMDNTSENDPLLSTTNSHTSSTDTDTSLVNIKTQTSQNSPGPITPLTKLPMNKIDFKINELYSRQDSAFFSTNMDDLDEDHSLQSSDSRSGRRNSSNNSQSSNEKVNGSESTWTENANNKTKEKLVNVKNTKYDNKKLSKVNMHSSPIYVQEPNNNDVFEVYENSSKPPLKSFQKQKSLRNGNIETNC